MARIAGVDIPREKRVEVALTYIYGVGRTRSSDICEALNIGRATRVRDLTDEEIVKVRNFIDENYTVEGDLRRDVAQDIKRKIEIGCFQGNSSPKRSTGQRATNPYKRSHPKGTKKDSRW